MALSMPGKKHGGGGRNKQAESAFQGPPPPEASRQQPVGDELLRWAGSPTREKCLPCRSPLSFSGESWKTPRQIQGYPGILAIAESLSCGVELHGSLAFPVTFGLTSERRPGDGDRKRSRTYGTDL
jgi:hypothetical protein